MAVRVPIPPFRHPAGSPMPPPVPTSTPLTAPPIAVDPDRRARLTPSGRYNVLLEDLVPYLGSCPACGGPSPRLRIDVPAEDLQPPGWPCPNYEAVAGYGRWFQPNMCSSCELRSLIGGLFPPPPGPAIVDPAQEELQRLRAELTRPSDPEAPPEIEGGLFPLGRVLITPRAGIALYWCSIGRREGSIDAGHHVAGHAHAVPLLERHARGDHGLVGQHLDGDPRAGSGQNPLASQVDRNAAAIEEGRGSVVSRYRVGFRDRRPDPNSGGIPRVMDSANFDVQVRTELGGREPLTVVALASELPPG